MLKYYTLVNEYLLVCNFLHTAFYFLKSWGIIFFGSRQVFKLASQADDFNILAKMFENYKRRATLWAKGWETHFFTRTKTFSLLIWYKKNSIMVKKNDFVRQKIRKEESKLVSFEFLLTLNSILQPTILLLIKLSDSQQIEFLSFFSNLTFKRWYLN